ncbi:uncharacterized protein LOC111250387 isoform X1 [Varroa destructor]|uniref:Uncharacterized protein n=2 Tax=Varroa destructor TaxID=109461 RepID=A0A7M7K6X0_VARDE|nr:uncharacterized protein LOC111250387 isoform X1 [Varroa destructor]
MLPASSSSSSETVYSGSRSSGNEVVTSVLLLMTASSGWTKEPHVPADVEALPSPLSPAAVLNPRPLQYSSQLSLLSTLRPNLSPVDINESGPGLLSASSARLDIDGDERSTGSSSYRVNQTSISSSFSVSVSSDHLSEFSCESLSAGGLSNKEASASKPMGSSSCCRPPNAYEKVLSLGCPSCIPCGRSSSDASLAVLLQVAQRSRRCSGPLDKGGKASGSSDTFSSSSERPRSTFGASAFYNPFELEQRQRHIEGTFRDFQIQSKSARHNIELNLPTHVRLRPGEGPPPSHGPWSERRRPPNYLDNCVRPPPNRSPFTPSASSCWKATATLKIAPTSQGSHVSMPGKNGGYSTNDNNSHSHTNNNNQRSNADRTQVTSSGRKML